jgi:hypothetical protein
MTQYVLYYLLLFFFNFKAMTNVSERNALKYEADKAILQKNYTKAVVLYKELSESTFLVNPELRLDLAHAYFMVEDTANASLEYKKIQHIADKELASTASLQIGLIDLQKKDSSTALLNFKFALEKNPENETARFNYEWLKKMLPAQKAKERVNQKTVVEEPQIQEVAKPKKIDLNEEETLKFLNAMKASDVEYLSKQRKIANTKGKKDW